MRGCVSGALVASLVVGATAAWSGTTPNQDPRPISSDVDAGQLVGLWSRWDRKVEGGPLRFWYFHGDGKGLYRYGRVGLANTNSFDYAVVEGMLELTFRKTGERHRLAFELERDEQGDRWLSIDGDPKEPGARYRRERGAIGHDEPSASSEGPGGRIWIDYRNWATGGAGFRMYQLDAPAIDGRGIGWFHQGDFDDWSTEALTYRVDGDHLEMYFDLREEPTTTHFRLGQDGQGQRWLELQADPRDFWATHRFLDGGDSFGGAQVWHWVTSH